MWCIDNNTLCELKVQDNCGLKIDIIILLDIAMDSKLKPTISHVNQQVAVTMNVTHHSFEL